MIQLGGLLSGFSLYALFTWLPIWRLATSGSAESIFRSFVVMMMLLFGVFMISGGKNSFSLLTFSPAFFAGSLISVGYRSVERRVGKDRLRQCISRWSPYHLKKNKSRK